MRNKKRRMLQRLREANLNDAPKGRPVVEPVGYAPVPKGKPAAKAKKSATKEKK